MTQWGEDAAPCQVAEVAGREAGPRHAPLWLVHAAPCRLACCEVREARLASASRDCCGCLLHLLQVVRGLPLPCSVFFFLCLWVVDGKCCDCSLCASTLSWSVCTLGCVSLCHCYGSSSAVAGLYFLVPITCFWLRHGRFCL